MSEPVSTVKSQDVSWWEKHVEYNFVMNAYKECGLELLSPLAGPAEAISDAITGSDGRFFIIEFKRTLNHFKDEYKKFVNGKKDFELCADKLMKCKASHFHFIIAGEQVDDKLELRCTKYFNTNETLDLNKKLFEKGMNKNQLDVYAKAFTLFKIYGQESEKEGNGGSGNFFYNKNVLSIGEDGKCSILPIQFYYKPKLKFIPDPTEQLKASKTMSIKR